uniref:Pancreatic trypsin inhibitor n=1 Tax=Rhipicephalus appendiculatus TaxID=34631 RepID=A0A131YFY4_RHIAP
MARLICLTVMCMLLVSVTCRPGWDFLKDRERPRGETRILYYPGPQIPSTRILQYPGPQISSKRIVFDAWDYDVPRYPTGEPMERDPYKWFPRV